VVPIIRAVFATLLVALAVQSPPKETWWPAWLYKSRLLAPQVLWHGQVWGLHWSQPQIWAFDSNTITQGAHTVVARKNGSPSVYATGSGLYVAVRAPQASLTYAMSGSKSFALGEKVIQSVSGAVGFIYKDTGSVVSLEVSSGKFDGTHLIKGQTSKVSATVSAISSIASIDFLEYSPDGIQDTFPTTTVNGTEIPWLPHLIVDCGIIKGPINGHSNTRVVLFGEYLEGNPILYYSLPDVDPHTWTPIMQGTGSGKSGTPGSTEAIRHFHGGIFVPGLGAKEGRLFMFSGDQDYQCSILVCEDVADLCNNSSKWLSNWGLDRYGADRVKFLTTGAGSAYCAGVGAQDFRTVELMVDANKQYGYWIPDQAAATNGNTGGTNTLHRLDLKTFETTKFPGRVTGTGWIGCYAPDGTILLSTCSEFGFDVPTQYQGNCDSYCHVYALGADNQSLYEITRVRRSDYANPQIGEIPIDRLLSAYGVVFGWDPTLTLIGGDPIGYVAKITHIP